MRAALTPGPSLANERGEEVIPGLSPASGPLELAFHAAKAKQPSTASRAMAAGVPAVAQTSSRKLCGSAISSLASGNLYRVYASWKLPGPHPSHG